MKLYVVEWMPIGDSFLVGIFTSDAGARDVYDAFIDPHDRYGWLALNQYEADTLNPLEAPKKLAERQIGWQPGDPAKRWGKKD
jgi:hypothetical protein